ncbi:hypothetical protein [Streptomyces sp. NPDC001889]
MARRRATAAALTAALHCEDDFPLQGRKRENLPLSTRVSLRTTTLGPRRQRFLNPAALDFTWYQRAPAASVAPSEGPI